MSSLYKQATPMGFEASSPEKPNLFCGGKDVGNDKVFTQGTRNAARLSAGFSSANSNKTSSRFAFMAKAAVDSACAVRRRSTPATPLSHATA